MVEPLRLLAQEEADLPPLSALVQDALLAPTDVIYDRRKRRLILLLSRFRWEAGERTRVRSALRIEAVLGVQRQRWPVESAVLDLLSIASHGEHLTLAFAGGASLRAHVECVDMLLEDMSEAWAVQRQPEHD